MTPKSFAKVLSANDIGATGGHQAGILVPKGDPALLAFFPPMDASLQNPDAWVEVVDGTGRLWKLRYIYYNNRDFNWCRSYQLHYISFLQWWTCNRSIQQMVYSNNYYCFL